MPIPRKRCRDFEEPTLSKLINLQHILLATLTCITIGCGENKTRSAETPTVNTKPRQVQNQPKKRQVMLGLFGGYLSCGSNEEAPLDGTRMVRYMQAISTKLNKEGGSQPTHVISCFGLDATVVNFITSADPQKVTKLGVRDFIKEFGDLAETQTDADLHVVGHSYGGWLSLQVASAIRNTKPPRSLTTVDPISHVLCTPPDVINSLIGNPVKSTCNQAPADLSEDSLQDIAAVTDKWLNFYQTDANLLHSGVLNGAENVKISFPAAPLDPHTKIADDASVIAKVLELVGEG